MQNLGLLLTSWEAATFLIGEYTESEVRNNPVFTVADGLFWLYQIAEPNSIVRKLQVMKLRGQMSVPGLHTFRITDDGLQAFSRTLGLTGHDRKPPSTNRLSMGIPAEGTWYPRSPTRYLLDRRLDFTLLRPLRRSL